MRKTLLALSALAAAAITVSGATRTEASPLVNPAGLSGAVDELAIVDSVHCRPSWRHHYPTNWRRADGCARHYRSGGVVVVPGRTRYVYRDGVRVRVRDGGSHTRTSVRSDERTTVRSRSNVNVREGSGRRESGANVNVRGSGSGGATTGSGRRDGGANVNVRGGASGGATTGGGAAQQRGGGQTGGGGAVQKEGGQN